MKQVVCDSFPTGNGEIVLQGEAHRHLAMSLRKRVGEHINLRLPSGELLASEIIEISKERIVCRCFSSVAEARQLDVIFVLLQWELKGDKMDGVIRSATEIGVQYILPVIGCYSVPRAKNEKEKLRRESIVKSAREQSGSPISTTVFESLALPLALERLNGLCIGKKVKKLLAYEMADEMGGSVFSSIEGNEEVVVVAIGAEGGISEDECSFLKKQDFTILYFGSNILRAETASIYALSSLREAYIAKKQLV